MQMAVSSAMRMALLYWTDDGSQRRKRGFGFHIADYAAYRGSLRNGPLTNGLDEKRWT